jgi:cleavage stimulation factor subunit 3
LTFNFLFKSEVWTELIKLENEFGTIEDIVKAEEKINQISSTLSKQETNDNRLIIEKFKFLDLLPCNPNNLRIFTGLKQQLTASPSIASLSNMFTALLPSSSAKFDARLNREAKYPDIKVELMQPFKPVKQNILAAVAVQPIPGGVFQYPTLLVELIKRLPPPFSFDGPFVKVEEFIQLFREIDLPNEFFAESPAKLSLQESVLNEVKIKTEPIENGHISAPSFKRPNNNDDDDESNIKDQIKKQAKMIKQI